MDRGLLDSGTHSYIPVPQRPKLRPSTKFSFAVVEKIAQAAKKTNCMEGLGLRLPQSIFPLSVLVVWGELVRAK